MAKSGFHAAALSALSADITGLAAQAGRAVVALDARGGYPTTGTVWRPGFIVTASHVLQEEGSVGVVFADSTEKSFDIVGSDPGTDLALLRGDTGSAEPLPTADVASLAAGTIGVALSRNSEKTLNASIAVINAIGGEWHTSAGGTVERYVRLDVQMYAGFSGGPLVGADGALIGINSSKLSRQGAVALPVTTLERVLVELEKHGRIRRGYLGIATYPMQLTEALRKRSGVGDAVGLMVTQVEEGSAAERSGMLPGDILIELAGTKLTDVEVLQAALGPETVGKTVTLTVLRGGVATQLSAEVGERPRQSAGHRGHWRRFWGRHGE